MLVPVMDINKKPLMPVSKQRASTLLKNGKASVFWSELGIRCIILKKEVIDFPNNELQIAIGIDPGSGFDGWSVVSKQKTSNGFVFETILNGTFAVPTVKEGKRYKHYIQDALETRRNLRRARRFRNCRRRPCRNNRRINARFLPPSVYARFDIRLYILDQLCKIIPVTNVVVEDVKFKTKKGENIRQNRNSAIEVGKNWFYYQIGRRNLKLRTYSGIDTSRIRRFYNLDKKSTDKSEKSFYAHSVDAWCLTAMLLGTKNKLPQLTKEEMLTHYWIPIAQERNRRALHTQKAKSLSPGKSLDRTKSGGTVDGRTRNPSGGQRICGFSKGTLVRYKRDNRLYYISGGNVKTNRLTLADYTTGTRENKYGKRISENVKPEDFVILTKIRVRAEIV